MDLQILRLGGCSCFAYCSAHSRQDKALLAAAKVGDVAAIEAALRGGADIQATDGDGDAALAIAAWKGHVGAVAAVDGAYVEAFGLWYVLFPALAGSLFIVCMSETCQLMKKRFEFELSDVASAFARS